MIFTQIVNVGQTSLNACYYLSQSRSHCIHCFWLCDHTICKAVKKQEGGGKPTLYDVNGRDGELFGQIRYSQIEKFMNRLNGIEGYVAPEKTEKWTDSGESQEAKRAQLFKKVFAALASPTLTDVKWGEVEAAAQHAE